MTAYLQNPKIVIKQGDYRSSFTGYTENVFSYGQQAALKNECDKGIAFLQSNSDCQEIRELYKDYDIKTVQAKRAINSKADKHSEINEVLIYYVPEKR